ncbi:hypothetical protein pb186bvf_014258 [Paramecium bursaria]
MIVLKKSFSKLYPQKLELIYQRMKNFLNFNYQKQIISIKNNTFFLIHQLNILLLTMLSGNQIFIFSEDQYLPSENRKINLNLQCCCCQNIIVIDLYNVKQLSLSQFLFTNNIHMPQGILLSKLEVERFLDTINYILTDENDYQFIYLKEPPQQIVRQYI